MSRPSSLPSKKSTRRSVLHSCVALLGVALIGTVPKAEAAATKTPTLDIVVVLASQSDAGSVDPQISGWSELSSQAMKSFNTFKVLDKKRVPFVVNTPVFASPYVLADGGPSFNVTVTNVTPQSGQPTQYKLKAEMTSGANTSTINLTTQPPARALIGAPSYKGGKVWFVASVNP
jgi:hypothetical protein